MRIKNEMNFHSKDGLVHDIELSIHVTHIATSQESRFIHTIDVTYITHRIFNAE